MQKRLSLFRVKLNWRMLHNPHGKPHSEKARGKQIQTKPSEKLKTPYPTQISKNAAKGEGRGKGNVKP